MARPSSDYRLLIHSARTIRAGIFADFFFLTTHKESTWIWGAGPIFEFPTASSSELGTGRWSAGPTAALVYSEGPWLNAILTYHLMSFAGNRARGSVNQTYIEPMISYNLDSGWYARCRSADDLRLDRRYRQRLDYPDGRGCGQGIQNRPPEYESAARRVDLLKRPGGCPQWITRVSVTFLFPAGH